MALSISSKSSPFSLLIFFDDFMDFWRQLRDAVSAHLDERADKRIELLDDKGQPVENLNKYLHNKLLKFAQKQQQQVDLLASNMQLQLYRQHLYAVCAIIDEQILTQLNWDIKHDWLQTMMELSLFESRNAGSKLIDQMEKLASAPHSFSQTEKDLALIYVKVIGLGFDGKYRKQSEKLKKLQERLLFAAEHQVVPLTNAHLFGDSYLYNINPTEQSRLAPFSAWRRYFMLGVGFYLLASALIWLAYTYPLNQELANCERLKNQGGVIAIDSHNTTCGATGDSS